jgi:hypothetical protein
MPYFHATAVFEASGVSLAEADRNAAALFKSLRHQRISYYEHEVVPGAGPYPPAKMLYFSAIADFDVEAASEERAGEMAEEVLENLATDEVQYVAFGLTAGEQRVRPEQKASRAREESDVEEEQEARAESGDSGARRGRGRGSRGRGRRRRGERETEGTTEEAAQELEALPETAEPEEPAQQAATDAGPHMDESPVVAADAVPPTPPSLQEQEAPSPSPKKGAVPEIPSLPPPRSSVAMRVTLAVSFHASELGLPQNGSGLPDQEELLSRATTEARRRHPELPAEVEPTHEIVSQPWGDTVLTLTWQYEVPVPSATDEA